MLLAIDIIIDIIKKIKLEIAALWYIMSIFINVEFTLNKQNTN